MRTKRGKKRLPNTPLIRDLVQFFIESEVRFGEKSNIFNICYNVKHFLVA